MAVRLVVMPKYGLQQDEGTVVRWLKQEGERVEREDVLLELETDKALFEHKAGESGFLRNLVVAEGTTVPVLSVIAVLTDAADEEFDLESVIQARGASTQPPGPSSHDVPPAKPPGAGSLASHPGGGTGEAARVRSSPAARKRARELNVDLATVTGTGPGGRVTTEDVERAAADVGTAPAPAQPLADDRKPLSRMRRAIGRAMTTSKTTIPHFYVSMEIDMTDAEAWRSGVSGSSADLTVTDLAVKAAAMALVDSPPLNCSLAGDDSVVFHRSVHIGLAVSIEDGLLVPVLPNVQEISLRDLAVLRADAVAEARAGRVREGPAATFTVSNLGMFGVKSFGAIINPPEAASLALGAILPQVRPAGEPPEFAVRGVLEATLSADHRLADGAAAARFLQTLKDSLEDVGTVEGWM